MTEILLTFFEFVSLIDVITRPVVTRNFSRFKLIKKRIASITFSGFSNNPTEFSNHRDNLRASKIPTILISLLGLLLDDCWIDF